MEIRSGDIARLVKECGWDVMEAQTILGDLLYTFHHEKYEEHYEESYVEDKENK